MEGTPKAKNHSRKNRTYLQTRKKAGVAGAEYENGG